MTAHSKTIRVVVCLVAVFLAAATLQAQIDRGTIAGTVTDPSGAAVQGASVTVTNVGTNQTVNLTTDSAGIYTARILQIGNYSVEATAKGFQKTLQTGIQLNVNQVAQVDLQLKVGSESQTTEVTAASPLLATETSSLGTVETQQRIVDLPLNGRLFTELAWLGPGTTPGSSSGIGLSGSTDDNRPGIQLAVNGLWAFDNNFLLDGVDNNGIGDGTIAVNPSPDAIGEFRVEESAMKAEFGRGGAAVNAALKSGTNQFHGGLYEYIRNNALDARNYFDFSSYGPKAPLHRNQFGALIGGPIIKNRTFFFADYQGSRLHEAQNAPGTVPTVAERGGDFTDLNLTIYDPNTLCVAGPPTCSPLGSRQEINPSNPTVIPTNRLDQVGLNIVNLYPLPNVSCTFPCQNFIYFPVATTDGNQGDVRIDHRLTDHDQLFGHASVEDHPQFNPPPLPGLAGGCCGGNYDMREQNYAVGWAHTFGTNVLNDLRFSFIRYAVTSIPVNFGQNISDQVGIPNANRGNEETSGLANISINAYSNMGNSFWIPELSADNTYQIADSVSWVRGKHTIKAGVDYRKYQRNFYQSQASFGQFNFNGQFTIENAGNSPQYGLPDLLLGIPASREQDGLAYKDHTRFFEFAGFVQDDFRVTPKLTLNLGLRYDLMSPVGGMVGNFNLTTNVVDLNFGPNKIPNAGVDYSKKDFGPRVGLAWTPFDDRKTVISAAFGIFYAPEGNQFNDLGENPPSLQYYTLNTTATTIPTPADMVDAGFPAQLPTSDPANPSGQVKTTGPIRKPPRVIEWNASIQRELARNIVLHISYVGTHATGIWNNEDSNLDQPLLPLDSNFTSDPHVDPLLSGNYGRPYYGVLPYLTVINPIDYPNFSVGFHGLETKLEKRFSRGLTLLASYTWSHDIGSFQGAHTGQTQIATYPNGQRGNVDPDFRQRLTISYTYELPFGRGKPYGAGMNAFENAVAGGWQVAGITTIRTGEHYTAFWSGDFTNTGTSALPDKIHDPRDFSFNIAQQTTDGCDRPGHQTFLCWYNPAAFVEPPLAPGQLSAHEFGTAGDGDLVGPDQVNFDFSAFKNFRITERQNLQFRAEMFNIFNHPQFARSSNNPDQGGQNGGSRVGSTLPDNQREIQFALRYTF